MRKHTLESLLQLVDIRGRGECWPWKGSTRNGYGRVTFQRKSYTAHRLIYELIVVKEDLPRERKVLHSCDNPSCCNWLDHLSDGTQYQNVQDAIAKGRWKQNQVTGEQHGRAVLSDAQVRSLRSDYDSGRFSFRKLALKFGISKSQAGRLAKRQQRAKENNDYKTRTR